MKQAELRRFERLYQNARYFGADRILRRYLGLPDDYVLPINLAHGVDIGQFRPCMDVITVEPIYWAYNERIYQAALPVKAAVKIPHALLLALAEKRPQLGTGRLVVGPPPGPVNDQRLLDILGPASAAQTTILVKPKRNFERSVEFWRSKGFKAVTLADGGPPTYDRIVELFSGYDQLVSCNFSSAVTFGAAMGMSVELLKDFSCRAYEVADIDDHFEFQSDLSREIVRSFIYGGREATTALAGELLGSGLSFDRAAIRASLDQAIEELAEPLYFHARYGPRMRRVMAEVAALTNRPGLTRNTLPKLLRRGRRHYVLEQEMNEIAAFVDGVSEANLSFKKVRYVPGETVPGDAVEQYDDDAVPDRPAAP